MISKAGYIGIMFASADPIGGIAPKGRKIGVFGTNPLSFSVPYKDKDITLDMSTAKYTWGDLVKADIEKRRLDEGFAFDSEGNPTTDPKEAMNGNVSSFDGSYKGLGIAFMIQILAGALVGSAYEQSDENCDYGSLIIAIDPQKLGGTVFMQEQTSKMINALKIKADSNDVLLPGEQSNAKYERNFKSKTIPVDENLYEKIKVELMSK
jgi:L-2-hydroxycarboxylate dehydrogenase (NAD+)